MREGEIRGERLTDMYTYNTVSRKPNRASSSSACRSDRSRSFWAYVSPTPLPCPPSWPEVFPSHREGDIYIARPSKANHIITTRPRATALQRPGRPLLRIVRRRLQLQGAVGPRDRLRLPLRPEVHGHVPAPQRALPGAQRSAPAAAAAAVRAAARKSKFTDSRYMLRDKERGEMGGGGK